MSVFTQATASRSARRMMTGLALVGVSALLLTGCSAAEPAATTTSDAPAAAAGGVQPVTAGDRDLTIKVGSLVPQSGALAFLGPPQIAGAALAAKDINDAKMGITVESIVRDEGDTTTDIATVSVTDLLSQDVSAILGAASSGVSRTVIDQITGAGVVMMSPSNTGLDFTTYADDGLYWRTAPSDVLQGEVLGNLAAADGNSTLGMIVLNDAYGTGLAKSTTEAFESAGGKVVAEALFNTGDSNFATQIADVTAANPDAIALITFDQSKIIIPALVGAGFPGDKLYLVDGNAVDYSADFAPGLLAGAKGTIPGLDLGGLGSFTERLLEIDPTLKDFTYAAESYDAMMLTVFAAYAANSIDGKTIASYLQQVSGGSGDGTKVTDFKAGAEALKKGEQINYDGFSGPITFNEAGDPTEATIGIYQYDADNKPSKRLN